DEDLPDAERLRRPRGEEADLAVGEVNALLLSVLGGDLQGPGMVVDGKRLEDLTEVQAGEVSLQHEAVPFLLGWSGRGATDPVKSNSAGEGIQTGRRPGSVNGARWS